jgi:tetratricopeptide (TPR) repeat protein
MVDERLKLGENKSKWCRPERPPLLTATFTVLAEQDANLTPTLAQVETYAARQLYTQAILTLEQLDGQEPANPLLSHWLGLLYYLGKQYDLAQAHYQTAQQRAQAKGDRFREALALRAQGRLAYLSDKEDEGKAHLKRAGDLFERDLADAAMKKRLDECIAALGRAGSCPLDWLRP